MLVSQTSPTKSLSLSNWFGLGVLGQLSQASPRPSPSESRWSGLGVLGQLSRELRIPVWWQMKKKKKKKNCKTELFDSFAVNPTVIIEIVVTGVSLSIAIRVFLVKIGNSGAVIASVTFFVGTFWIRICLIWICYQWTIVLKMVTRISKQNVINKMAASSSYRRHALSRWRMGRLMTQGNLTKNTTSFRILILCHSAPLASHCF